MGVCFGVADWYVMEVLITFFPPLGIFGLIPGLAVMWGVWLVPALAVVAAELRVSQRLWRCAAAVMLLWMCALVGYYLFYGFLMAFDGDSPLSLTYALGHLSSGGWENWLEITRTDSLRDLMDWGKVALVGGGVVGAALGAGLEWLRRRRSVGASAQERVGMQG